MGGVVPTELYTWAGLCLAIEGGYQIDWGRSRLRCGPASLVFLAPREAWSVIDTPHAFSKLVERLETAAGSAEMAVVNAASASEGAKALGVSIPGNRVVGVFRNDFAQRMLKASVAAGIEAPLRFYVTENPDGTATLAYRTPSSVFAPYFAEGGEALEALASELDGIFAAIAEEATGTR